METRTLESNRKTYIALDQSLANTGYCILYEDSSILTTGVIKTKSKDNYYERLLYIESKVSNLIIEYKPDYVFYEDVFAVGKGAWRTLIEVKIVLELLFHQTNTKSCILSPLLNRSNSWRKLNNIKSSDKKYWKDKIHEKNEHIADAIGIGLAGIKLIQRSYN